MGIMDQVARDFRYAARTLARTPGLPLRSFLVGVRPVDPVIIAAVAGLLTMVAILASWIPAHRASGIDPTTALRRE